MSTLDVNYTGGLNAGIMGHEDLLTCYPIIIFGEGNFSYAIALASIRGKESSWTGITVTTYEEILPSFEESLQLVRNHRRFTPLKEVSVPPPKAWVPSVDARSFVLTDLIHDDLMKDRVVLWFQCPWCDGTTGALIRDFIAQAQSEQQAGFLCIGIIKMFPYVTQYDLSVLLGLSQDRTTFNDTGYSSQHGYRFIRATSEYADRLLDHGYVHEGVENIHKKIKAHHLTLVFEKVVVP